MCLSHPLGLEELVFYLSAIPIFNFGSDVEATVSSATVNGLQTYAHTPLGAIGDAHEQDGS